MYGYTYSITGHYMKKICILAIALSAMPVFADNKSGFYLGAGASHLSNLKDTQDATDNLSAIRSVELFGGYKYNNALGVELRLGNGMKEGVDNNYSNASGSITNAKLTREIDNYEALYYKAELINKEAKLYALLGYSHVNSNARIASATGESISAEKVSASGYSYGLGIGFVIDEHFNINFEYKNLCDELSDKPNLASINVDYRF
jgi:outer membrane autotransporter protein